MGIKWDNERVLVTGGAGFLGSHVVEALADKGATEIIVPRSHQWDLVDGTQVTKLLDRFQPTVIIHLAAKVGGIGANQANPGKFFYENLMMGVNLVENARHLSNLKKFVQVGTICSYPKYAPIPFREEDLWNGYPEETNAPYGIAKKALLAMIQAYRQQYGFPGIYLLPVNLYGPRDNFDLETSHVIPAMIRKFVEARASDRDEVVLWGTGEPTREFLYVSDAAAAIVRATDRYNDPEPVNIGSHMEISIRDLADLVKEITGYRGAIRWDPSRPNGQPRRKLNIDRALEELGFRAETEFRSGVCQTIRWYEDLCVR